ncbi:deoxyribodipyrimidine photo-lyase [Peteryoungia aggregata LMG 23059]|uniref:Deoxyribodipyrimidine photo-lyase n=1 Tax=Peteryoungia aggregata LMG 23059 TaxID=1368425 RepID=A0ABU0G8B4_9HYPH|nr:deoxyribodipyrimidine photo-lyase [Peteryoungia aggregata]MDQ0420996.1 deoxyribodipyrimidine photo-lyase [Peteryoungia aggregata LMG 23059]
MPDTRSKTLILWFRKDLRLSDHAALATAAAEGFRILPLYIREPEAVGTGPLGAAQEWWLHHSLDAFGASLQGLGSRLILRSGPAETVFAALLAETGASAVFWNRRYDPCGIAIDKALKAKLIVDGIEVRTFAGQILHEPTKLKTGAGGNFRVYTPFWKALDNSGEPPEPIPAPPALPAPDHWPDSETLTDWGLLPTRPNWARGFEAEWQPGEAGAHKRLAAFVKSGLKGYRTRRDFPGEAHISKLSPHLALGEISPATLWHATRGLSDDYASEDYIHFRKEVVWRDFSYHLLFHFPDLATKNWNAKFDAFPWRDAPDLLQKWQRGQTGYPIVDAGMRQLWQTGWMHNRVRMIVASFLIKDLLVDWREGERWFRDTLVDADPASNAASWQWVAGSGADAAPFFRIFNPVSQGEKFDPEGAYIRRFVPELKDMPAKFIHKPSEAPLTVLKDAGVSLGKTYPKPIVDHGKARDAAMAAFQGLKAE